MYLFGGFEARALEMRGEFRHIGIDRREWRTRHEITLEIDVITPTGCYCYFIAALSRASICEPIAGVIMLLIEGDETGNVKQTKQTSRKFYSHR